LQRGQQHAQKPDAQGHDQRETGHQAVCPEMREGPMDEDLVSYMETLHHFDAQHFSRQEYRSIP